NPDSVAFGDQLVGVSSGPSEVTILNQGPRTITNISESLTGSAAGDFSVGTPCASVASHASCRVTVSFTPTQPGPRSANLVITDPAAGSPQAIPLSGNGIAPVTTLTPNPLTFTDPVAVGSSAQKTVTLKNDGTAPLVISSIATTGSSFSQTNACPGSLDPTQ